MKDPFFSRRRFLKAAGAVAGSSLLPPVAGLGRSAAPHPQQADAQTGGTPDYTLTIAVKPVELAPNRIISTTTYNGQFPGPLLRFKEGQRVTIDIHNQTDRPEQLHWHGQFVSTDVDGAAEEGTPFIAPQGSRRISFVPSPSGYRFYHTHVRAKADLSAGQYSGLVGPVYIEPKDHAGNYDREVFLTLKEFEPTFSRGGDMAMDFLSPATVVPSSKGLRRERHEGLSGEGRASWIRSRVRFIHHQRAHAGPWRTDTGEARGARSVSHPERKRDRDSQPGAARAHLHGGRAGWKCNSETNAGSGAVAGHSRKDLCHRGDESSRSLDHGRSRGRRSPSWHGYRGRICRRERQAAVDCSETVPLELRPFWRYRDEPDS